MFSIGHYYGIGNCGLAMVTSRCPECGETIGGGHHELVETSQDADELNAGLQVPITSHSSADHNTCLMSTTSSLLDNIIFDIIFCHL